MSTKTNSVAVALLGDQVAVSTGGTTGGTSPSPLVPLLHAPAPTNPLVIAVNCTGVGDETAKVQAGINQVAGTGGTLSVMGTCNVHEEKAYPSPVLRLKSNMTFKMQSGAVIKMIPTSSSLYAVLYTGSGATNINIIGGTLIGERNQHIGDSSWNRGNILDANGQNPGGEYGFGIWVNEASSNIYIEGVTAKEMWGDGFAVGGAGGGVNRNINFYGVVADDNRRQGMSLMELDGGLVRDSIFSHTDGAWPNSGIDLEPYNDGEVVKNTQILNNQFMSNHSYGVVLSGKPGLVNSITVNNNSFVNNGSGYWSQLLWGNPGTGSSYSGNTFTGSGSNGDVGFRLQ
jgi:polygalacturonase